MSCFCGLNDKPQIPYPISAILISLIKKLHINFIIVILLLTQQGLRALHQTSGLSALI